MTFPYADKTSADLAAEAREAINETATRIVASWALAAMDGLKRGLECATAVVLRRR